MFSLQVKKHLQRHQNMSYTFNPFRVVELRFSISPPISLGAIQIKLFQSYLDIPIGPAKTHFFGCILKCKEKRCGDKLRPTLKEIINCEL